VISKPDIIFVFKVSSDIIGLLIEEVKEMLERKK